MKKIRAFGLSLVIVFLSSMVSLGQNSKLEKAKEEVKTSETGTEEPAPARTNSQSSASDGESAEEKARGIGQAFRVVGQAIFYTYCIAIGPRDEAHKYNFVSRFPYEDDSCGNYIAPYNIDPDRRKGRIDIANHVLLWKDVNGNHLKVKLRPSQQFYLQTDYILLLEERQSEPGYDQLGIYNLNFCFDRLRFQNFNVGWMLGANIIGSGVGKAGFTYGLNIEYFTPWRLSLVTSLRGSNVNTRPLNQFEVYARYSQRRFTLDVGYEVIRIGSQDFHFLGVGAGFYL